jgi:hypothetical protein
VWKCVVEYAEYEMEVVFVHYNILLYSVLFLVELEVMLIVFV